MGRWIGAAIGCLAVSALAGVVACSSSSDGTDNAAGAGGDPDSGAESSTEAGADSSGEDSSAADVAPEASIEGDCSIVKPGTVDGFKVNGLARKFILDVPTASSASTALPVVFNWHGLGDTAQNMRGLMSGQVNSATFPFILVTPEDSNFKVMGATLDWDVFTVNDKNREVLLFDAILGCLKKNYSVDENHVHSLGFSIGGIVSDVLGTVRGDELASVMTYSGGYLNDPDNHDPMMDQLVSWPSYAPSNKYVQMFAHGGTNDTYNLGGAVTIHFDQYAIHDSAFLAGKGHDNILCEHGQGHNAPAGISSSVVATFFSDHPKAVQQSPYRTGLPAAFPSFCVFKQATP